MRLAISFLLLVSSSLYVTCLENKVAPNEYAENTINNEPKRDQPVDSRKTFKHKNVQEILRETTQKPTEVVTEAVAEPVNVENDNSTINSNTSEPVRPNNILNTQPSAIIQLLTEKLRELFVAMAQQNIISPPAAGSMMDVKNPPSRGPLQLPLLPPLPRSGKKSENNVDAWDFLITISNMVGKFGNSSNIGCHSLAICLATDGLERLVEMTKNTDSQISSYLSTMSVLTGSLLNKDVSNNSEHYEPDCMKRFASECQEAI